MAKERQRLINVLTAALPAIDFEASENLVDDGILDSLAITAIIAALSMEYCIRIPFEELESRDFNSIDAMLSLVARCPKAKLS